MAGQRLYTENPKSAIKLLVEHLYENRAASTEKVLTDIPMGVRHLLSLDRNGIV